MKSRLLAIEDPPGSDPKLGHRTLCLPASAPEQNPCSVTRYIEIQILFLYGAGQTISITIATQGDSYAQPFWQHL